jgi:hypothetical protein
MFKFWPGDDVTFVGRTRAEFCCAETSHNPGSDVSTLGQCDEDVQPSGLSRIRQRTEGHSESSPSTRRARWHMLTPFHRHRREACPTLATRSIRFLPHLLFIVLLCGCASSRNAQIERPFTFGQDTFSYPNDLVWVYYQDPDTGKFRHKTREVRSDYTHHCFPVARSARQFFQHSRFEPAQPKADEATYRKLIRRVVKTSPRKQLEDSDKIVIPGYTNLFQFSQGQEKLLKAECGGAWQSYFQRGHWRMVFPFSERHQEKMVAQLQYQLQLNRPPVVHIVRFPSLAINHALVIIGVDETPEEIRFAVYDPYDPVNSAQLTFNRKQRQFYFPANDYFVGGKVDIYEIYCSWNY